MKTLQQTTTPLVANGVYASPWMDRAGSGDIPYITVSVLSDQAGSFLIYESETRSVNFTGAVDDFAVVAGGTCLANIATVVSCNVNRRNVMVIYTNGATAQTSLTLTVLGSAVPHIAPVSPDWRALDLILRELRAHSLLLENLKSPSPTTVNIPYGPTNSST